MSGADKTEVDELIKIKTILEKNMDDLYNEAERLRGQLAGLRDEKSQLRKMRLNKYQELYKLRISLVDILEQSESSNEQLQMMSGKQSEIEDSIGDLVKLKNFESEVNKKIEQIEKLINFYSEDSLQIELMKRSSEVRDKRVIYTNLDKEYKTLVQQIQEEKRKKELARQAELERKRQEEEALARQELPHQTSNDNEISTLHQFQRPFLSIRCEMVRAEAKSITEKDKSPDRIPSPANSTVSSIVSLRNAKEEVDNKTTFSQLLRW